MGYRGDDLDLRVPQNTAGDAAPAPQDPFSPPARSRVSAQRNAPIWVDDTVLECCNHAFDVAAAHRAIEVRIEHLVYALTRVEDASEALEARGIRVAALRREAATVIATEIPADPGSAKTMPRRSDSIEEVLRVASTRSYRRQAAVSVNDVIYALFDSGADFPALYRLIPSNGPRAFQAQDLGFNAEAVRERIRSAPIPEPPLRSDLANLSATQMTTQQARLDAIEHAMRNLTTELASERKLISGVLQDLQRELMAQRDDTSRLGNIMPDKIQAVFGDRLQSLEQAFLSSRNIGSGDPGAVLERIGVLERALHTEIGVNRAAIEALAAKTEPDFSPLLKRMDVVEAALASETERAAAEDKAIYEALAVISSDLANQPEDIASLLSPPIIERLDAQATARDAHQATAAESFAEAHRRLAAIEEALAAEQDRAGAAEQRSAENHAAVASLLERLAEAIAQNAANAQDGLVKLTESLTQDFSELHDGLGKVNANQHTLATTLDAQSQDSALAVASIMSRIDSLEQAAAKPVEMLGVLSGTVDRMHRITVERYYRRNRFWYWLFGTDDWLAASWPSQSARIAEELRNIKG